LDKVKALPEAIGLQVIYVKEEKPPAGKRLVAWFPAMSEPVNSIEEAYEYVGYYTQRWKIERSHYVLKSGCAIWYAVSAAPPVRLAATGCLALAVLPVKKKPRFAEAPRA
jgi:hypothetical protein